MEHDRKRRLETGYACFFGFHTHVASPVVADGIVYAPSRVRPILALKAGGRGDVSKSHLVWTADQGPDVPTPATDGKYIFILNDRGILWCRDAKSGVEIWGNQRIRPGTYGEKRLVTFGILNAEVVVLVHTERDDMHVISLRKAERYEARYYFEVAKDYFRKGR